MTAEKRVKIAYLFSMAVLIFQVIDVFFLHNQNSIFASNVISRIVGIIGATIVSSVMGLNLKRFCFKTYGFIFEILYGFAFSLIPIIIVFTVKYFYFRYRDYSNLVLTFRPSGFSPENKPENFILLLLLYVLTLLLIAVFKEFFYRGFLITQLSSKYGVLKSIVIQTVIYTASFIPSLVYYIVTGRFDSQGPVMTVFLVLGHLFYNFICGIKWGMFYKVNGTVWMSIADHFLNSFIISSFFFTENRLPEKWYIIEVVSIQILSFIMFFPFYLHRDKMNVIAAEEYELSKEALKMGVDNYSPSIVRKKLESALNSKENDNSNSHLSEIPRFEEPVSYDTSQLLSEEDLTLSVRGYAIDDSRFEYDTEVSSHDSDPSLRSKEFFENLVGKNNVDNLQQAVTDDEEKTSNADNISKLVENYFNNNFDKHTFTKK